MFGGFNKFGANLYFHIPFCLKKCRYCYFYSIANQKPAAISLYLDYLEKEIILKKRRWRFPRQIKTIYIGGGTPSYLSLPLLKKLFAILYRHFSVKDGTEFTAEINPAVCDKEKLEFMKSQSVNRLSFGIQTTDPKILKLIGRRFDKRKAVQLIQYARKLGFETINLDFMFCLPGQTTKTLAADVEFVKKVKPDSVYWYETKRATDFMKKMDFKEIPYLTADTFIETNLKKLGFKRLMTEFYTKTGQPCEYTFDWLSNDYVIGFGPFAISKIKNKFYKNISDLKSYYRYLDQAELPIFKHFCLNKNANAISHFAYLIRFGSVNLSQLSQRFRVPLGRVLSKEINLLVEHNFIKLKENKLFLTHKGLIYTPEVQIILLNKCQNFLRGLNFFLGRGYNLR